MTLKSKCVYRVEIFNILLLACSNNGRFGHSLDDCVGDIELFEIGRYLGVWFSVSVAWAGFTRSFWSWV